MASNFEARDFCTECLPYIDVLFGIEPYHLWKDENFQAFASGLIYAMMNRCRPMGMVNFAAAIRNLMNMNYDIKR